MQKQYLSKIIIMAGCSDHCDGDGVGGCGDRASSAAATAKVASPEIFGGGSGGGGVLGRMLQTLLHERQLFYCYRCRR